MSEISGRLLVLYAICFLVFFGSYSRAEWITGAVFSEQAGIDSLNQFMVIPDTDSNCVFGYKIIHLGYITEAPPLIINWMSLLM